MAQTDAVEAGVGDVGQAEGGGFGQRSVQAGAEGHLAPLALAPAVAPAASSASEFVLTLSCPDAKGIVHAVSGLLYQAGCNILDSQQFGDVRGEDATGLFFMRVHFDAPVHLADAATLTNLFGHVRSQFSMRVKFHSLSRRPRVLLMVSKHGHCLNDLLFRWKSGQLEVDIPAIVSNHPDFAELTGSYGIPFHHLPLHRDSTGNSAEAKRAQEREIQEMRAWLAKRGQ